MRNRLEIKNTTVIEGHKTVEVRSELVASREFQDTYLKTLYSVWSNGYDASYRVLTTEDERISLYIIDNLMEQSLPLYQNVAQAILALDLEVFNNK